MGATPSRAPNGAWIRIEAMKVGRTSSATGSRPAAAAPAAAGGGARAIADVTTVMGISEAEFTPKVRAAIMALMQEVESLRRELQRSQARIQHLEQLADQDPLAPVANRRAFVREMSRVMSYAQRYGTPSSILYFDLNGMKAINDGYGHAAGDKALLHVVNILIANVRESDIVGRIGGDEFSVLLVNASAEKAQEKARMLAHLIAATPFQWDGREINLSVACGAYCFKPGEDATTALANADKAMYADKQQHRETG